MFLIFAIVILTIGVMIVIMKIARHTAEIGEDQKIEIFPADEANALLI